ncbi:MAG: diacylglycerol kinase family lipid kinase [Clostridia bacterium]|nr:diacylglycerol kinase family lipid kinase [Clostridia bacterium]
MRRTYHIISNPAAGKTKSGKSLQIVQDVFTESGAAFETHLTERAGDATEIARRLTENGETEIIALGGDGTLHEVLNGLADPSACNFGLIPSGTGNDFAEKIGLPLDADATARIVLKGEVKETDYLEVGGMRCMNVAGVGMDVDVLERCQKGKMKGKLKYFKSLLQSLFSFKGYRVEIQSEEVTETRDVLLAAACNGSQFGGGIRICPAADVADGKLDVVIVDCLGGKWKIIKAFMALLKGKILEYPAAKHFLCDTVKFLPKQDCAMQLDGELYRGVPFDVKLRRGLKFYR